MDCAGHKVPVGSSREYRLRAKLTVSSHGTAAPIDVISPVVIADSRFGPRHLTVRMPTPP